MSNKPTPDVIDFDALTQGRGFLFPGERPRADRAVTFDAVLCKIEAACGIPDPAKACRTVLQIIADYRLDLSRDSFTNPDIGVPYAH